MTPHALIFIKKTQRYYKERYGEELIVDFAAMNKEEIFPVDTTFDRMKKCLDRCLEQYGADMNKILEVRRLRGYKVHKEIDALDAFAEEVVSNKWNTILAGKLINKHYGFFTHYKRRKGYV